MNYYSVKGYAESLRERGVREFNLLLPDGSKVQMVCGNVTAAALEGEMARVCAPFDPESDDFSASAPSLALKCFGGETE